MKILALVFISLIMSFSTFATEEASVNVKVCNPTKSIESWTFDRSYNTYNDVPDRRGYLRIRFARTINESGSTSQTTVTYAVNNLKWDKNFKNIIYTSSEGDLTTCAKKNFLGLRIYKKDCYLEDLEFGELSDEELESCKTEEGTHYSGRLIVK
ncbi:MAG: hypothetical protein HOJ35_06225 [Bdellovibrionales bacterium]|jgi:hypothetical protein|nr:hypothetical protein [Bdellovibrionales bacterium]